MVDEPDEKNLQGENKSNEVLGFSTAEALKRLSDDIDEVVKSYETKFKNER